MVEKFLRIKNTRVSFYIRGSYWQTWVHSWTGVIHDSWWLNMNIVNLIVIFRMRDKLLVWYHKSDFGYTSGHSSLNDCNVYDFISTFNMSYFTWKTYSLESTTRITTAVIFLHDWHPFVNLTLYKLYLTITWVLNYNLVPWIVPNFRWQKDRH